MSNRSDVANELSPDQRRRFPEQIVRKKAELSQSFPSPSAQQRLRSPDCIQPGIEAAKSLVKLHTADAKPPLFCVHGLGGHVAAFLPLAVHPVIGRTVYAFQGRGLEANQRPHDSIEAMATCYLEEMRGVQQRGPYLLAGWSMGGLIAMELVRRLEELGQRVAMLILFDTHLSDAQRSVCALDDASVMNWIAPHVEIPPDQLRALPQKQQWEVIAEQASRSEGIDAVEVCRLANVCKSHWAAISRHEPKPYRGESVLFQAAIPDLKLEGQWKSLCPRFHAEQTPGDHYSMLRPPNVDALAKRVGFHLSGRDR
jgi:thioesterase domain-containing protein